MQNKRARKLKEDSVFVIEMSDEPLTTEKREKLKAKIEAKWTDRYSKQFNKDVLTWNERDSTQVTDSEDYQRHVLDTSKLPESLSTLVSQLLEQLEKGNLDAALG